MNNIPGLFNDDSVVSFVLVAWIIKRKKWTGMWTLKPVIILLSKTQILRNETIKLLNVLLLLANK